MKKNNIDILTGDIRTAIVGLSLPIVISNLIQTALGIIDMIWVGKLGSGAVSAIGTASFYINLATALTTIVVVGTGVKIAHSIGTKDTEEVKSYIKNGVLASLLISIIYVFVVFILSEQLISYFGINDIRIESMAKDYLIASLYGVPLLFLTTVMTTVFTSFGETKVTFKANSIGLILNILLDPLMIFGVGIFPTMGIVGAAWATNISRLVILMILILCSNQIMKESIVSKFDLSKSIEVFKMGFPVTIQRVLFIYISMVMAKIIVSFGAEAIAVQKIGVQIESISYVTIGGLQGAMTTFVGQNYGRKSKDRVIEGYNFAFNFVVVFGLLISLIFIVFPRQIFSIFIREQQIIDLGVGYMTAIGISQVFMCLELLTVGAFNGIGKTYVPPIVSIALTILRLPMALYLSRIYGLNGVWWSISISSILKGIILVAWFKLVLSDKKGKLYVN